LAPLREKWQTAANLLEMAAEQEPDLPAVAFPD
jgi:hypothetical protein